MPNYVISQAPGKVVLRNFEGYITTYTEPLDYDPHEIREQEAMIAARPEPGQGGVFGLLEGHRMSIEPEGFAQVHARGGGEHRLRSGDLSKKWQPLGIGSITPDPHMLPERARTETNPDGIEEVVESAD
jgi:lysine 2,3-aminomutase